MKKSFSPEFRNRIDAMISFAALDESVILKVVDKFLSELKLKLKAKKVSLEVSLSAKKYLARVGYEPAYGARPLARLIQDKVKKPLAEELLFGKLSKGGLVKIDFNRDEDKLTFNFEN